MTSFYSRHHSPNRAAAPARAGKLTQAVLARAFRGELVPTEAELAGCEGRTYEPASALLEHCERSRAARPRREEAVVSPCPALPRPLPMIADLHKSQ